jgi:ATP-dependent protease ClpP protease subunit
MLLYDASAEHSFDWRKRAWSSYHRWRAPAQETWDTLSGEVTGRAVARIINALEPDSPLTPTIDSEGGDPVAAFELYAALRSHVAPVVTISGPTCNSAAVIAYLGGDVRIAGRNSTFLLHTVAADPLGRPSASSLRAGAEVLAHMDQQIQTLFAIRCKRYGGAQIRAEMAAEVTLDAAAAQLRGIATSIAD